jgi:hypothetical protein
VVFTVEIRKIVVELDFILVTSYFREVHGFVKGDLGLCRQQLKCCVPGAAIRVVEPASQRMCVGERGIDYRCVRHIGNELMGLTAGSSPRSATDLSSVTLLSAVRSAI